MPSLGALVSIKHFCEGWGIISRIFLLHCYTNCHASLSFSCLRMISQLLQKWEYKYYFQTLLKINRNGYLEFCSLFKIIPSNSILRWLNFLLWDIWLQYPWWNVIKVKHERNHLQFWCLSNFIKINLDDSLVSYLFLFPLDLRGNMRMKTSTWNWYNFMKYLFLPLSILFY